MIIENVFQVHKNQKTNTNQNLDGRLLNDISINDELFICGNRNECLNSGDESFGTLLNTENLLKVAIVDILSYGQQWELLNKGMSARIKCQCDREIEENEILFKIIK